MGRPRKKGKRVNGRLSRAASATAERNPPNERILQLRKDFAFVRADPEYDKQGRRIDGRTGEIDNLICDAVGQMCELGLLDGCDATPQDMRDAARAWAGHRARLYRKSKCKTQNYERQDKAQESGFDIEQSGAHESYQLRDRSMTGYEREVLSSLCFDHLVAPHLDDIVPWAQSLIDEALFERGVVRKFVRFPTQEDRDRLEVVRSAMAAMAPRRRKAA